MKTHDLISQLSKDLKPVKTWGSPEILVAKFLAMGVIFGAGILLMAGMRADISGKLHQLDYQLGLGWWSFLLAMSLYLVFALAIPAYKISRTMILLFAVILISLILWHVHALMGLDSEFLQAGTSVAGIRCSVFTVITSLGGGALLTLKIRQGASGKIGISSLLVAAASLALGGVLISLNCGDDNGMHVALWHFLIPALTVLVVAMLFVRRGLRW